MTEPASIAAAWQRSSNRYRPQTAVRRGRFAAFAVVYCLAIVYVSVVPFNFVAIDAGMAWQNFLLMPYLVQPADQRADWMGNLFMFAPLGFSLAAAFRCEKPGAMRWLRLCVALVLSLGFVLAVKYLQLFFPGRTVTLNYVFAQITGAALGGMTWVLASRRLAILISALDLGGRQALIAALVLYAVALLAYFFFPFDLVLTGDDVSARLTTLPHALTLFPGAGRPRLQRVVLLALGFLSTVPVGMLLATVARRRIGLIAASFAGLGFSILVFAASFFVMDAQLSLGALIYRTLGIVCGVKAIDWLHGRGAVDWERHLAVAVRWLVLPYILLLVELNDLVTPHWLTYREALGRLDVLWTLPLVRHYEVAKAWAAASVVTRCIMYAPIGAVVWAFLGQRVWLAAGSGAAVAGLMEVARFFKPGLAPDSTNVVLAALAAGAAVVWAPLVCGWLSTAFLPATPRDKRERP